MTNPINTCYKKSIELLLKNSTKHGILAASQSSKADQRNYLSIFGRDASICSLGMALSGNEKLIVTAKKSLDMLAKFQAKNGQIPFFVKPEKKEVDFYYLGCIDSTLWWLIAVHFLKKHFTYDTKNIQGKITKALNWLLCQEHQQFFLLEQNEASDWADLMPRSGYVLYTNALWYSVKKIYRLSKLEETKNYFNYIFDSNHQIPKTVLETNPRLKKFLRFSQADSSNPTYSSFKNYSGTGNEIDVFGNILACLMGLADSQKSKDIVVFLKKEKANIPFPIKAVLKPINKKDKLWRDYMSHLNENLPNQYHNGGIWPFIGNFWTMLLTETNNKKDALQELENIASLNEKNNWEFNEWFDGKKAKPMGVCGQSWNAAMFILAYQFLNSKIKHFL